MRSENGSAVVLFLALLAFMLMLMAANGKTLLLLKKELQLIEQRQTQRLERFQSGQAHEETPAIQRTSAPP